MGDDRSTENMVTNVYAKSHYDPDPLRSNKALGIFEK